jgi:hypothetical protein
MERMVADLKKKPNMQFSAAMFGEDVKLMKEQIKEAKQLIADGKEFGKDEYAEMVKERKRASDERMARDRKANEEESQRRMSEAAAERDAAIEQAESKFSAARGRAFDQYRSSVGPAELERKFQLSNGQSRLVIWNLPFDGAMNKRSTNTVNVRLMAGKKVAWQRKEVKLDRRQAATQIQLPKVMFDKIVVDIVKWSGDGGGLAEIQAFVGDENVALGRQCKVTSIETTPKHLDDEAAVTDGITIPTEDGVGYWIPEERTKATVTIDLLSKAKVVEKAKPELEPTSRRVR